MRGRIAALLLVLTLGGAPVLAAVCEYTCFAPSAASVCHSTEAQNAPSLGHAASGCDHAGGLDGLVVAGRSSASVLDSARSQKSAAPDGLTPSGVTAPTPSVLHGPPGTAVPLSSPQVFNSVLRI